MTLTHLLEMLRKDGGGAEGWPVLFTAYKRDTSGEWREVDDGREAITSVEVDCDGHEVLLVRDSGMPALSLKALEEKLGELVSQHADFTVDSCEGPIDDDGMGFRIDMPVVAAGRDAANKCVLVIYAYPDGPTEPPEN